jgi:hypothetical protein
MDPFHSSPTVNAFESSKTNPCVIVTVWFVENILELVECNAELRIILQAYTDGLCDS